MLVASTFDLWQKDQFFSAAEEVQESADTMESAYRRWIKERREGLQPEEWDELCSELQTALGTAKWQLEEFEKAVRLSYGHQSHRWEDNATARHRQFIEAIEDQISRVETSLRESFSEQGKQPFRWVNLDEEERDDLAAFLSGAPQRPNTAKNKYIELKPFVGGSTWDNNNLKGKEVELDRNDAYSRNTLNDVNCLQDVSVVDKVAEHIIEIEPEMSEKREDIICQVDRTMGARKTWGSPRFSELRVAVADEDLENKLTGSVEVTPKEKGYKPVFRQLFDRAGGLRRQPYSTQHLQFGYSVRFMLVLMITIFLVVPYVFYST